MRPTSTPPQRGFTLIELMVTVAIVAILGAIALPSYRDYVMRGYLVDATTLLSAGQANIERYYQDNRTYATAPTANPSPCAATQGKFTLSCTATATGYVLTAAGIAGTAVANFAYTIDATNAKTTTITGNPGWNTPSPSPACWIVKKGGTC